jgi:hypothetical protein
LGRIDYAAAVSGADINTFAIRIGIRTGGEIKKRSRRRKPGNIFVILVNLITSPRNKYDE